jgi:hypothetical protein
MLYYSKEKISLIINLTFKLAQTPTWRPAMGKLASVVLLSLHVAQTAGFAPCPPAAVTHVASARRPLLTASFRARPRAQKVGARHLSAIVNVIRTTTLSRDAAQYRTVAEPTSAALVSAVLSRGMAALDRAMHVLMNQLITLASLVFAPLPAAVLSGLLVFSAAPSLVSADQVANPRVQLVAKAPPKDCSEKATFANAADAAPSGSKQMKMVTIASAGGLALHMLLSHRIFEAQTRRRGR